MAIPVERDETFELEDDEDDFPTFWAVELVPGKEYETVAEMDLRITAAVLPASAKDVGRSVVSLSTSAEPDKSFAIVSLRLDSHESQTLEVFIDRGTSIKLSLGGPSKNHVHLSGHFIVPDSGEFDSDDEDEAMYGGRAMAAGDDNSDGEELDEFSSDEDVSTESIKKLAAQVEAGKKRKALENGGGEDAKKPKVAGNQQKQQTPNKPAAQQPKQPQTPKQQGQPQQPKTPQGQAPKTPQGQAPKTPQGQQAKSPQSQQTPGAKGGKKQQKKAPKIRIYR